MACVDKKLKAPLKQGNVLCHKWVFSGIPKPELIMGDDHCSVVHYLISWWAEGVPDIGFSLCTAPTYCQVSEYFRLKSQGFGLMPKDVRQRCRHNVGQCHKFLGFGVWPGLSIPKERGSNGRILQ